MAHLARFFCARFAVQFDVIVIGNRLSADEAFLEIGVDDGAPVFYSNPAFEEKGYPFSEAVEAGGFIFLSGQLGTDPASAELVEGGIEAQARQTMENIKTALERRDLTFANVVKCTVMIDDMADWPAFNAVYAEYFEGDFPARSASGADGLALGAAVEVECIAYTA